MLFLEKNIVLKQNKNLIKFSIWDPTAKPQPRKQCNNYFTKTFFLQHSWSCPQAYLGAGGLQKFPLDGATLFLATIWQHITTVIMVLTRKPKNAKRVWIGPTHKSVYFKSLCGCLPMDSWSCVHPLYARKNIVMMIWPLGWFSR